MSFVMIDPFSATQQKFGGGGEYKKVISQSKRRSLLVHEVTSTKMTTHRYLANSLACSSQVDTILVLDESCGWALNETQCDNLKDHLSELVSFYNVSQSTRFGIVGYRSTDAVIYLSLPEGVSLQVVNSTIQNSGVQAALQMFSTSSTGNSKSMIVYPICNAVDTTNPPSYVCSRQESSDLMKNVTVSVYVSGDRTSADYYDCLVTNSKSVNSTSALSDYFYTNMFYRVSQYLQDAKKLESRNCPSLITPAPTLSPVPSPTSAPTMIPTSLPTPLITFPPYIFTTSQPSIAPSVPPSFTRLPTTAPTLYQDVQFIIAGGYTGECCPPDNPECNGNCENPNTVWSVNVTNNPTDLQDPCIAARYYNNSNTTCGSAGTTHPLALGRQGARIIYYDCDSIGPTLWVFGGRENDASSGALRSFSVSNPIDNAYPTCPGNFFIYTLILSC
ncbi:hypothetical protein RFI_28846 [Reticulomyxa filosa]|uniref:VWFA domain-containing protein n=1 Tax=Reticulomyxa filosa TaxID=46433 RepID=X6M4H2_RETFI|nr:hypothetical protein RFI_28846 [Reticulomyxa filosa]|eukprot:ETO08541.1 hypothetical protein RFI_28846 [Reticulomyxa filosa]